MKKFTALIDKMLVQALVWLMAVMVVVVTWQVTTRYLLNSPSSYTEELATYLLIWISLLGAAYALRLKAHLGIDVLTRNLTGSAERTSQMIIYFAIIAFSIIVFIYGGIRLVYVTLYLEQLSAAFKVPVGYVYLVIPLSGLLMVYYSIYALLHPKDELQTDNYSHTATGE